MSGWLAMSASLLSKQTLALNREGDGDRQALRLLTQQHEPE
ncbi:hypothetical protein [Nitrospira defluvii]|nr:hypothetical protein [Nitrospira defluvii]